jgi:hypothetical protein
MPSDRIPSHPIPSHPTPLTYQVRGSLYSTVKDEFKKALHLHQPHTGAASVLERAKTFDSLSEGSTPHSAVPSERRSHFCSKVIAEFYQHMGWMDSVRPPSSVMPGDFGGTHLSAQMARPVELLPRQGTFEPLQIIWSSRLGVQLPMKKPRKATK